MSEPTSRPDEPVQIDDAETPEGRFILISGPGAPEIANAVSRLLPRAASVDGEVVAGMIPAQDVSDLERLFTRWTAGIALADSFRIAGFDAVVAETVPAEHLEDYLDFAAPAAVHLVRVDRADGADGGVGTDDVDGPGLRVAPADADAAAADILARLDEARLEPFDDAPVDEELGNEELGDDGQ